VPVKNLLSHIRRAAATPLMAPVAAVTLGALSAPADLVLISPAECLRLADSDPIVALGMLTSELADRSDRELFEQALVQVRCQADGVMDQHINELASAIRNDASGALLDLLGEGLSRWVEVRERDRIIEAGGEPWQLPEYDPFVVLLEKFPELSIYPLLEERIRDMLNQWPQE